MKSGLAVFATFLTLLALPLSQAKATPDASWIKTYDAPDFDVPIDITQSDDGNYILTGQSYSFPSALGPSTITKIDKKGNILFQKRLGDFLNTMTELEDTTRASSATEKYVSVGSSFTLQQNATVGLFVRTSALGALEKIVTYELTGVSFYTTIRAVAPGNNPGEQMLAIVTSPSPGQFDLSLAQVNEDGKILSYRSHSMADFTFNRGDLKKTSDGGYIIFGSTIGTNTKSTLLKFDSSGQFSWGQQYAYQNTLFSTFDDVVELRNGGFLAAGSLRVPSPSDGTFVVARLAVDGSIIWEKHYNAGSREDTAHRILLGEKGKFFLGMNSKGGINSKMSLLKFNSTGNILWSRSYSTPSSDHYISGMLLDGRYVVMHAAGKDYIGQGESSVWVARLQDSSANGSCYPDSISPFQITKAASVSPFSTETATVPITVEERTAPSIDHDFILREECSF